MQSGDRRDYDYMPLYGHDMVIPGIEWTHSHFVNKPLLFAKNQYRIKICGGGKIRMNDPYTKDPDISHYATNCEDRIHIVPVVFSDCHDIVLQDFDIMRTNCYHTSFDNDSNLFVGNVKMYDAACVSGDGLGLSSGTHRVKIERCFFESNDDGVTLSSSYRDPRNNVSPWRTYHDLNPHGARCVTVEHSYFSSGGGKAIAVIPWGSTNPEPLKLRIVSLPEDIRWERGLTIPLTENRLPIRRPTTSLQFKTFGFSTTIISMSAVCCALRRRTFAMTAEFRQVPRFSMAISGTADAIGAARETSEFLATGLK